MAHANLLLATVVLGTVACGGDDPPPAAATYVIDSIDLPETADESEALGVDLDGDGTVDNHLANILAAVDQASVGVLDSQAEVDVSVDQGSTLMLATLAPGDGGSGFALFTGANPVPSPCNGPGAPCRQHLDGGGAFDVAAGSPVDRVTVGAFLPDGSFYGTDGELVVQLKVAGAARIELVLVGVTVAIREVSETGLGASVIAGGIPGPQITARLIPELHAGFSATVGAACPGVAGACDCAPGSSGEALLRIFDDDQDCALTREEILDDDLIAPLFVPDIDTDGDGVVDALSIGFGITAVAATFEVP